MKYTQAAVLALAVGASAVSAAAKPPAKKPSTSVRVGKGIGQGLSLAGAFADAASGGTLGLRDLSQDPASLDPAGAQAVFPTVHRTHRHRKIGTAHHKSATEAERRKTRRRKHRKVAGAKADTRAAKPVDATGSTETLTKSKSRIPIPTELPAVDKTPAKVSARDYEDELEARWPRFGRVGLAGAVPPPLGARDLGFEGELYLRAFEAALLNELD